MKRSRRRLLAAGLVLPLLASCGLLPPLDLKSPRLTFVSLSVPSASLQEIDLLLTVNAENPNEVEVPLSNIQFDFELFGQSVATGSVREPSVTLPRLGSREIPIRFKVSTARLLELPSKALGDERARFEYRLRGSANWGSSPIRIPFEKTGDLEALRQLPRRLLAPSR